MKRPATIPTPRLRIAPFGRRHLTARYVAWLRAPANVRFSEQRHRSHSLASCRRYAASFRGTSNCLWAMEARDASLGHIGNLNAYVDARNGTADLGILVGESAARGRGLALEAWVNVCAWLIECRGVRKVTAGMLASNEAMVRLARRAGMRRDGRRRRQYLWEGREVDVVYVALFAREWPRLRRRFERAGLLLPRARPAGALRRLSSWLLVAAALLAPGCATTRTDAEISEATRRYREQLEELAQRWNREPLAVGSERQVFYDDALVHARSDRVSRKLAVPRRLNDGNPMVKLDKRYEKRPGYVMTSVSVTRKPGGAFTMWYQYGFDAGVLARAVSKDGLRWKKSGGLLSVDNFVMRAVTGPHVMYDPHDWRPWARYKLIISDHARGSRQGYSFAYSGSGKMWRSYSDLLQLATAANDSQAGMMWDEELQAYRVTVRERRGSTRDVRQYVRPVVAEGFLAPLLRALFVPVPPPLPWICVSETLGASPQIYQAGIYKRHGVYVALVTVFDGRNHSSIATSRNGIDWNLEYVERGEWFLQPGPDGSFDDANIYIAPTPPVIVGDEEWVYYQAYDGERFDLLLVNKDVAVPTQSAIGAQAIRRDGVLYLECAGGPGDVLTKLLAGSGNRLLVNADASKGALRVEVIAEDGSVVPGYSADDCDPWRGDSCDGEMTWRGSAELATLRERPVRLRFVMEGDVRLYAFQFVR